MKKLFLLFSIFLPYLVSAQGSFGGNAANNVTHMRYSAISVVTPVVNGDSDVCWMYNRVDSTLYRWTKTTPVWTAYSTSGGGGFTNPMTAQYDLIVGGTSGTPTRQAVGANNTFLGVNGSGVLGYQTATQTTAALNVFTTALNGLVPTPGSGGTTLYLRQDGTWDAPPGGSASPGGSNTQVQYNVSGTSFGGISGATSDGTNLYVPTLYGGTGAAVTQTFLATNNGSPTTSSYQFGNTTGQYLLFSTLGTTPYLSIGETAGAQSYMLDIKNTTSGQDIGWKFEDNYAGSGTGNVNDNYWDALGKYGWYATHNYNPHNAAFLNEAASGSQHKANFMAMGGSSALNGAFTVGGFADGSATKLYWLTVTLPNTSGVAHTIVTGGASSVTDYATSLFTVESTTLGSIPEPSMTTTQQNAISSPQEGLRIYDNVLHVPAYYNGTAWIDAPTSGTYTPTLTNTTNITSSTLDQAYYTRVGNIITVTVTGTITPTTALLNTQLTITFPFTTSLSSVHTLGSGSVSYAGVSPELNAPAIIQNINTTTFSFFFPAPSTTGSSSFATTFQYTL